MTSISNIIKSRRSIRKYTNQDVSEADVNKLIEAVKWSPSWSNSQCWEIVVIRDLDIKKKLQSTLPSNPAKDAIVKAPVLLALCAKTMISGYYKSKIATKFGDWFMYDLGIATQSLCLMAHSIGLGTVIVGLYDHEIAKKIINIPIQYELVTMVPVGYPATVGNAPKRRDSNKIIHKEVF